MERPKHYTELQVQTVCLVVVTAFTIGMGLYLLRPVLVPFILAVFLALGSTSFAQAAKKLSNRQFPDGTGSSKEVDPSTGESIETFYDVSGRVTYKIRYKLDARLQPVSGIYYNSAGRVFQKSAYKLDPEDRIIQEVVYDSRDRLVCTKNFEYGMRTQMVQGKQTRTAYVEKVYIYDANGRLKNVEQAGRKAAKKR